MRYSIIQRLAEPTSWGGLAGLAALSGMDMETFTEITTAVASALGFLVMIFTKEAGSLE